MKAPHRALCLLLLSGLAALSACENSRIMGALNPGISTMTPASVAAGTAQFSIQISGSNFTIGVQMFLNGSPRPTSGFSLNGMMQPQISGTVFASDVAMPGTAQITVVNPGGMTSNVMTLTITPGPNPVPLIASVSPASAATAVSSQQMPPQQMPVEQMNANQINDQQIIVEGANFVELSQIFFGDHLLRVTKFHSDMELEATIPAALLRKSGPMPITVRTPAPGGGTSNPVPFDIR
jgi:trimeric autotransporter adhesin